MLAEKSGNLMQAWSHSILNCSMGSSCISIKRNDLRQEIATLGEDMVWNPVSKRWICLNCYNYHFKTTPQKLILQSIYKEGKEDERAFDEWLSKQLEKD